MSADKHHELAIQYGTSPKTLTSCVVGFVLSLILTLIAFWIAAKQPMSVPAMYIGLAILAALQLITQVYFFLRINTKKEGRWNSLPFLFTIFIIMVILCGSLWIMYNLNYFMMH